METNKPSSNTADDMKSLSQRQNELATLIMQSAAKDPQKRQSEALRSQTAEKKVPLFNLFGPFHRKLNEIKLLEAKATWRNEQDGH